MTNICLGLFNVIVEKLGIPELVAQLSTSGTNFFKYMTLGTDNTETEGFNIAHGYAPTVGVSHKTVNWTHPDGRVVSTVYHWGFKDLPPAAPTLTPIVQGYTINPFILVDGDLVAKLPSTDIGPAHLETISGVEYLVSYAATSTSTTISAHRYKLVLDMSANQQAVAALVWDSMTSYTDVSGGQDNAAATYVINPFGEFTVDLKTAESIDHFYMHERQMVTNADATKTVFFTIRKWDGLWKGFPVFEITHNDPTFSVTEIDEFINTYDVDLGITASTTSQSGTQTTSVQVDVDPTTCGSSPTDTIHIGTCSGTKSGSESGTVKGSLSKYFMGCAYNRKTDLPIILQLHEGQKEFSYSYTVSQSWSGGAEYTSRGASTISIEANDKTSIESVTFNSNGVRGSNQYFELLYSSPDGTGEVSIKTTPTAINTISGTTTTVGLYDDGYTSPFPIVGAPVAAYTFASDYAPIDDFNVISLAHLSFVYIVNGINETHISDLSVQKSVWDTAKTLDVFDDIETELDSFASTITNYIMKIDTQGFSWNRSVNTVRTPTTCSFVCGDCESQTEVATGTYS